MKSTLFLFALLFAFSGFVNADEYKFGVEGWLTTIDNQAPGLIDCDLLAPPIPYQVCYSIDSDAPDREPSESASNFEPISVFVRVGDCEFISDDHLYGVDNEGPNGDEVYLGAWAPIDQNHHWQIAVWAADTSPSNFIESDDLLPTAPDISLADRTQFIFDIMPVIHTEGAIESWLRDAPFCESTENLLTDVIADIIALNLQEGVSNSLDGKLSAAFDALTDLNENNDASVINRLNAVINEVEAQRGKKISDADADYLVNAIQDIIDLL